MTDPGTIRIRSIEDLRTALESPDPMTCLFTLQAIAADPERALSYGQKDGTDVIDLVIAVARQGTATALGAGALLVLGRFRDPRVAPVILDAFATSDHDESVTACAEFLQASATAEVRSAVTPWLFQDADETRARIAARVLAQYNDLTESERLRVALIFPDGEIAPPELNDGTLPLWIRELEGAYSSEARELLATGGPSSCRFLVAHWEELPTEIQGWLLKLVAAPCPDSVAPHVQRALRAGESALVDAALEAVATHPWPNASFQNELAALWNSTDPKRRLAVLRAGLKDLDWLSVTKTDPDIRVRAAAVKCLARDEGEAAADTLGRLLEDEDWRLRAAAADSLKTLGDAGTAVAQERLHHARNDVRLAAVQVMLASGCHEFLERELFDV